MINETAAPQPGPVAPWRHTLIFCAILVGLALSGLIASGGGMARPAPRPPVPGSASHMLVYLVLLGAEAALFLVVRAGLRRSGTRIADLLSRRSLGPRTVAFDLLLGFALFTVVFATMLLSRHGSSAPPPLVQHMLVRHAFEIPLWIAVSLAAGFVEELAFRGYLQRQFASRYGVTVGIVAQALLFGLAHSYQGVMPMIRVAVLGLLFGLLAWARGSLVPGMAAHAALDIYAGLKLLQ